MSIRDFIVKLQNLPDKHKKIIMWVIVAILALTMGFFWLKTTTYRLSKLGEEIEKIDLSQIENQIPK